jgi:hypothetical protein
MTLFPLGTVPVTSGAFFLPEMRESLYMKRRRPERPSISPQVTFHT